MGGFNDIPPKDMVDDMCLVLDEWTAPNLPDLMNKRDADKAKKQLRKALKKGNFTLPIDSQMKWRLCAARIMREQFLKPWCFEGFEYRSNWALNFAKHGQQWKPMWLEGDGNVRVLMEQGIGDEILFASTFSELIEECPSVTIEIDSRLKSIMQRSFTGNFVSRWILGDEVRQPQSPEHYDELGIKFDQWVLGGDLLRKYRTGKKPPRTPYLLPNPELVEKYRQELSRFPKPWVGISWKGGRSKLSPGDMKTQGTHINLQYGRKEHNGHCWLIGNEESHDWVEDIDVDHNNMEEVFALVSALDEVVTTQNYITHVCGSIGKKCSVIKPPPVFGPVGTDESENNRLKWHYGLGGKHPWYQSVTVYNNVSEFVHRRPRPIYDELESRAGNRPTPSREDEARTPAD